MVGSGAAALVGTKTYLAAGSVATPTVLAVGDTTGLQTWLKGNVITVVLIIIAISVMFLARRKKNKDAFEVVAGVFIALIILGLAQGTKAQDVGTFLAGLVFG